MGGGVGWGWRGATGYQVGRDQEYANHPPMHQAYPTMKNEPALNVHTAEDEKNLENRPTWNRAVCPELNIHRECDFGQI